MARPDAVSYEHDYRTIQGPLNWVVPSAEDAHDVSCGFCPRCFSRLSGERTLCFDDEHENQCAECLVVWEEPSHD